ncbi:MAG: potA [Glaciihabitans sp.]|nr:potA [Glaciihabitans sp.]
MSITHPAVNTPAPRPERATANDRAVAVEYAGVRVDFGAFTAIPDLNLSIEEGEFFTFLGPSGCGKTTALRVVAGFVNPAAGSVRISGVDVTRLPSDARGVGMVFQNYALFPSMNVRQNIEYGLRVQRVGRTERDARVEKVARRVDLSPEQLDRSLTDLSGGQQQRVAIARAMVMQPTILLLDEPLSNLDAKLRVQLRGELKALQHDFGITTVYVTHDQDEALTMSDRIAVFNRGRVEQVGTPTEVYSDPQTEFVCTFVGESSQHDDSVLARLGLPSAASYVRLERTSISPTADSSVALTGLVTEVAYHGIHVRYAVQVGEVNIKVLTAPSSERLKVGAETTVHIDPADVLQFNSEGQRMMSGDAAAGAR